MPDVNEYPRIKEIRERINPGKREENNKDNSPLFIPYNKPPAPIGGFDAIQKNLKYPEIARKAGLEGIVVVKVLIDERGEVVATEILKSLGQSGCDEAAIIALKSVNWKPAMLNGKPVKVWVSVPVIFKLSSN